MLPTESIGTMTIKIFGSDEGRVEVCDVVRLAIRTRDGRKLEVPLLTVPQFFNRICWNLVIGEVIYQDNCPTAVKTLLSWVQSV